MVTTITTIIIKKRNTNIITSPYPYRFGPRYAYIRISVSDASSRYNRYTIILCTIMLYAEESNDVYCRQKFHKITTIIITHYTYVSRYIYYLCLYSTIDRIMCTHEYTEGNSFSSRLRAHTCLEVVFRFVSKSYLYCCITYGYNALLYLCYYGLEEMFSVTTPTGREIGAGPREEDARWASYKPDLWPVFKRKNQPTPFPLFSYNIICIVYAYRTR